MASDVFKSYEIGFFLTSDISFVLGQRKEKFAGIKTFLSLLPI